LYFFSFLKKHSDQLGSALILASSILFHHGPSYRHSYSVSERGFIRIFWLSYFRARHPCSCCM